MFILLQLLGCIHVSSSIPLCCAPERVGGCELRPRSIWLCVDTGTGSCHGFSSWTCRSKLPSPKISAASYSRSRFLPRAWLFVRCRHIHVSSAHSCLVQHVRNFALSFYAAGSLAPSVSLLTPPTRIVVWLFTISRQLLKISPTRLDDFVEFQGLGRSLREWFSSRPEWHAFGDFSECQLVRGVIHKYRH